MGSSKDFSKLRKNIDKIDEEILGLLTERGKLALEIRKVKSDNSINVFDPARERDIEKRLADNNDGPLSDKAVLSVFREIISSCRALQNPLTIAYLGPDGSFSHRAALHKFGAAAELVPVGNFEEVFTEVENGRSSFGVVPVENSVEGSIGNVLDLLSGSSVSIVAEFFEIINHFLLSQSGDINDIKVVASHPQPIAQCRKWLNKNLPAPEYIETKSTTEAAKLASEKHEYAAIASEHAASIYNLKTVQNNIEDHNLNTTRFFVIGDKINKPTGEDRTSIVFTLKDKPGALQRAFFQPFADEEINLTKIESRPSKENAWEYRFFVDFKGHKDDELIRGLLREVKTNCEFFKVLGSYPIGTAV